MDAGQVAAHPAVAPLIVGLVAAVVAFSRRVLRTLRALDDHVLPHFRPAEPGHDDHTLPARVARVEDAVTSLDGDLRTHMAEEARQRGDDVHELRGSIARVHDRIDALTKREARP
jgi:hypothetical protein